MSPTALQYMFSAFPNLFGGISTSFLLDFQPSSSTLPNIYGIPTYTLCQAQHDDGINDVSNDDDDDDEASR